MQGIINMLRTFTWNYEIQLGGNKRETYLALAVLHLIQLSSSAMCEDILVFEKFKWS